MRWLVAVGLLCLLLSLPVTAQTESLYDQQLEASGAATLTEHLPKDVGALLEKWSLDWRDPASYTGLSFDRVLHLLADLLQSRKNGPMQAVGSLLGVVLVGALFRGIEGTTETLSLRQSYHTVAVLAAGSSLLLPLFLLMEQVVEATEQVAVFMGAFVPVYGGILATGGGVAGAVSYQTTLLAAAEVLTWGIHGLVIPLLMVSLAMGCAGAVATGFCLEAISAALHKGILWALGLFSTLFSGLLSLQQMVAASGDSLGSRAMKFSLASFVPVVGGLLSEAYSTVVACSGLLRSTVGCFGLLAVVLIVLPPLCSCVLWQLGLAVAGSGAALFGLSPLEKLCKTAAGAVRVLIGVLAVLALLMVVSTSVVAFVGRR